MPGAKGYWASGQTEDTTWSQPPLAPLLLGATIAAVGDDAWGWRLRSVLLGALSAVLLALLARALYPGRPLAGWVAGVLLALDPLHVLLSRSTLEEVQATCFFLAAAWLVARHLRTGAPGLALAGIALGGAHASKGYYHVAGALLLAATLVTLRRRGAPAAAYVHACVSLVAAPAAVYVAAYLPWFGRGYGFADFLDLQRASWHALAAKTLDTFENARVLAAGGTPASWFVRPTVFGFILPSDPDQVRAVAFAKNVPAWVCALPAMALVAWRARREAGDAVLVGLFAGTYLPLLLLSRPLFLYSAIAVLPFALLALGRAADLAWSRSRPLAVAGIAVACASALYLYPLATGIAVPAWAYLPVLSRAVLF